VKSLILIGSVGFACGTCAAAATGLEIESTRLEASDKTVAEDLIEDVVDAPCAAAAETVVFWIAALENVDVDEDAAGAAALGAPAAPATLAPVFAIPAVENVAVFTATVWRVVPVPAPAPTGAAAIAPLGNDPAPQRH